jgi:hypothetical protein
MDMRWYGGVLPHTCHYVIKINTVDSGIFQLLPFVVAVVDQFDAVEKRGFPGKVSKY